MVRQGERARCNGCSFRADNRLGGRWLRWPPDSLPIVSTGLLLLMMVTGCREAELVPEDMKTGPTMTPVETSTPAPMTTPVLEPTATPELVVPTLVPGELSITKTVVETNPNSTLSAVVSAETSIPARVYVAYGRDEDYGQVTGWTSTDTRHQITVVNMLADTDYHLRLVARTSDGREVVGEEHVFHTGPLPDGIPTFEVITHDPFALSPGVTLLGFGQARLADRPATPAYLAIDHAGNVVWYYFDPQFDPAFLDRDLKMLSDGTFLIQIENGFRVITIGGDTTFEVRTEDVGFREIHHDAFAMPNGHFLTLVSEYRQVMTPFSTSRQPVKGDSILEIDASKQVVWEWSTFDHLDTTRFPTTLSRLKDPTGAYDWTHSNAVVYLPDEDAILLSVRNQQWVLKIDHQTGAILWRLGYDGDFELTNYDPDLGQTYFSAQHAPEFHDDGTLLLFDNGNERPEQPPPPEEEDPTPGLEEGDDVLYSRGVAYHLDEATLQSVQVWDHVTDYFVGFLGDADQLPNGNILLCAGGSTMEDEPAQVLEVTGDLSSELVWELDVYEYTIDRATRLSSFYLDTPVAVSTDSAFP